MAPLMRHPPKLIVAILLFTSATAFRS
jgi:hypothetical protein